MEIKKSLNILVLGVGGNVSVSILKALRNSSIKNLKIFGACVQNNASGFAFSDAALICPYASDKMFIEWLKKTEESCDIDVVISGVEEVIEVLAKNKSTHTRSLYLTPDLNTILTFNDKLKTIHWLQKQNIDSPKTIDLGVVEDKKVILSSLRMPFSVKPKIGKGSMGIKMIREKGDIDAYIKDRDYIAQEIIGTPNSEYTCGVYKSKFGYTEIIIMKRNLSKGSTSFAEVVYDNEIENYCRRIADSCETFAPFNIQLRKCVKEKKPYCFEINMRLSGTTSIRHEFGFRDCEAWICEELFNQDSRSLFNVTSGTAIRYEEEVFFKEGALKKINKDVSIDVSSKLLR